MPHYTAPTFPQTLTTGGSIIFQLDPMHKSVIVSASNPSGCTLFFENSSDQGVNDPWSPAGAVREATMMVDGAEATGITPVDGIEARLSDRQRGPE